MTNIYLRKDGRWEARIALGTADGKRKYRSVYGKTREEAEYKLMIARQEQAESFTVTEMTVRELTAEWLHHAKLRLKESTVANYRMKTEKHLLPAFGDMQCCELTCRKVYDFIEKKLSEGLSPRYVSDMIVLMKSIYRYASREYHIRNVLDGIILPKSQKSEPALLSPEQQKQLKAHLSANPSHTALGIALAMHTGIRIGELCALQWEDIDLEKRILTVRKTMQRIQTPNGEKRTKLVITAPKSSKSIREIPIPACMMPMLREYAGKAEEYVLSGSMKPVEPRTIKNVNIINSHVNTREYSDFGFIVCDAYNYRYQTGDKWLETSETLIQHCTVSHSTFTAEIPVEERETQPVVTEIITAPVVDVPDDIIVYDDEGYVISETQDTTEPAIVEPTKHGEYAVGGITGLGGQLEDCYVEDFSITANLEDYILYAGGISGKPANVLNSVVYNFGTHGKIFNAGGIAGSCAGARFYDPKGTNTPESYGGTIQGCAVIWASMQSELAAGGITGEASTNAEHAMISNCYTKTLAFDVGVYQNTEKVKAGAVGGIVGTDGNEKCGHLIMNCVSPSDYAVIGSRTLSRFDDTMRLAPDYAFYQENILSVINRNAVHPDMPKDIFTGSFKFDSSHFTNNGNAVAYPAEIEDLFANTIEEGQDE